MSRKWQSLLFDTCEAGVSSAVSPELLPNNQNAWGMNIDVRGGKPSTRPNLRGIGNLPAGLLQGCEYFGVQGGMLVASIAGRLYRIRIRTNSIDVDEISLTFRNSSIIRQVWMTQTVETLVIQDGQSNAIMYDGSTATRAILGEVPRGRQMAYGNGRLWVAVNANEVVAGDIRTGAPGSELLFTEATYLTGGGKLFFPKDITGMAFIPVTGQSDYGALLVYGAGDTNAIRADITSRDDWGKIPGFVTGILRSVGASGQWGLVAVNQDLYWRDSNGGIRSIRNALADEAGPGSAPVSREVSRLTDYDSLPQLAFCSGVYFDNRLLMTSSPYLLPNGGVGFRNLISLDYAPLSTMGGKSQPAYNGQWNGLNFVKLVGGQFNGKNRAFALTTDDDGNNQLWEFGTGNRADNPPFCFPDGTSDGTAEGVTEYPIQCAVEYPLRDYGQSKTRKRLTRCDVWLSAVNGEIELQVDWRSDNSVKWLPWDKAETCAQTSDPSTATPHVWKNLTTQERPQFKTFTIPDTVNDLTKYAVQVGFEFQIRLRWKGRLRIHRMQVYAQMLDDPDYANRDGFAAACVEDDITGNEIIYKIPTNACPIVSLGQNLACGDTSDFGVSTGGVIDKEYTITNVGLVPLVLGDLFTAGNGFEILVPPAKTTLAAGESTTFTVRFNPSGLSNGVISSLVTIPSNAPDGPCTFTGQADLELAAGVALDCASESGNATLCGLSEYTTPSVPPKKYRQQILNGFIRLCNRLVDGCTGGITSRLTSSSHYSGGYQYSATTCAETNTQDNQGGTLDFQPPTTVCGSEPLSTQAQPPQAFEADTYGSPASFDIVTAPTIKTWTGKQTCLSDGLTSYYGSGFASKTLFDEDTELDAMTRATKTPGLSCTAKIEPRSAGDFTFSFVAVGYDINCDQLVAGYAYRVRVTLTEETYGGGSPVVTFKEYMFTASGPTHTVSDAIDCPSGKQVTVSAPIITIA